MRHPMTNRTRTAAGIAILGLGLSIAACSNEPDTTADTTRPTSTESTTTPESTDTRAETTATTPTPAPAPAPAPAPETSSTTIRPAPSGLVLGNNGLGAVDFGEPIDSAMAVLTEIIGSPADTAEGGDFFEYSGWQDLGLFVGFSTSGWSEFDGTSRFIGWSYSGSADGPHLRTEQGVGIGTPVSELLSLYGDRLTLPEVEGACGWVYEVAALGPSGAEPTGVLDRAPSEDARVTVLYAGLGVGC